MKFFWFWNSRMKLIFTWNWFCADDTGMFYGMKFYNDLLMEAGPFGNVQSEVLLQKDKNTFSLKQGWAFPRKVYFNGDECMLPPPDTYPYLPNSAYANPTSILSMTASLLLILLSMGWPAEENYNFQMFLQQIIYMVVLKARQLFCNRYIYHH